MKNKYIPRFSKCRICSIDNAVEPHQAMTVKQMLIAFTKGKDLPDKIGSYDENPNIDEVGYSVGDRLEAVDYMNAVNQRIALAKKQSEQTTNEVKEILTETPVENTPVSND